MKRLITIAMFAGLWLLEIPAFAQDQPPAGAQASPPDQPTPGPEPQREPVPADPQTPPATSPEIQPQTVPPVNPPNRAAKSTKKKKPATKASAPGHKVVIRNGGAKDESAQLAPGLSKEQERHIRETTTQLLATTDANLKNIVGRQLTPTQQSLFDQVHTYVRQSKDASDAGDLDRAHTLANKAHLLSDELLRK
jgi:hypothetical protein